MNLTQKLKQVSAEAKKIRESLTLVKGSGDVSHSLESGERIIHNRTDERYQAAVMEMAGLLNDTFQGRVPTWHLREAMSTADFPLLFGDVLNRMLLGQYAVAPVTYPGYFEIHDVNDFRSMKMLKIDGGGGPPLSAVSELAPYPETSFTESQSTLSVAKYGRRYDISFEMMINDDLNAFQKRPRIMATDARLSEEYLATQKLFDANGPHASFFSVGNANIITANPALSIAGLATALGFLGAMKDSANRPITITEVALVVPPALEITALNILNATELRVATGGGAATDKDQLIVRNWMQNRLKLYVNSMIPIVCTDATKKNTSWILVAKSPGSERAAFHFGFLRGNRQPLLSMRTPNNVVLSGSNTVPEASFENDAIAYRVRHIFGAATDDVKLAVASNGSGS